MRRQVHLAAALALAWGCSDDESHGVADNTTDAGSEAAPPSDMESTEPTDVQTPPRASDAGEEPDAGGAATRYTLNLPRGFPQPLVPADNPLTDSKVELGRHLFYDKRLSGNGTQSCATCHKQELAFSDGRAQGLGSTGELHPRSPMSLANVAYLAELTWANPLKTELSDQALVPLFGEAPIELGILGREAEVFADIRGDGYYAEAFRAAFPEDPEPLADTHLPKSITLAIAAFERTLLSGDSDYDRFSNGDRAALSASAQRGMRVFFSEETECFHCHSGFAFSDAVTYVGYAFGGSVPHHNTGLYNLDGKGAYPLDNEGLFAFTGVPSDMGAFRTPTLRNVGVTAPYMHDGSIATLREVVDHYARGGRAHSALTSVLIGGFTLSDQDLTDLVAFLESLTDQGFLHDQRFSDPWSRP